VSLSETNRFPFAGSLAMRQFWREAEGSATTIEVRRDALPVVATKHSIS
jgi:hypothetical protein